MTSQLLFTALVLAVGVERLVELAVSKRHAAWAFSRGGKEFGRGHFPAMVALHTALLFGALAEVWILDCPFRPILGWVALAVVIASQTLRWWCIATLGRQWNTRVIVVPGLPLAVWESREGAGEAHRSVRRGRGSAGHYTRWPPWRRNTSPPRKQG